MSAARQIAIIRGELEAAADTILSAVTLAQRIAGELAASEPLAAEALGAALTVILEATSFEDLVGQRLARLASALDGALPDRDPLLNGPADAGCGLDQTAADQLFDAAPTPA